MIRNFIKTLIAYYISAFGYWIFVEKTISYGNFFKILFLNKIEGYSEFLLSFAFMYILIFLFNRYLVKLRKRQFVELIIFSYISILIGKHIRLPNTIFEIVLGGNSIYCLFPILQYSSYFYIGYFFSKRKILFDKRITFFALISFFSFSIYYIMFGKMPNRFPPSIFWILGGYFPIYTYYIFVKMFNFQFIFSKLSNIGSNSLIYLVVSNLVIFVARDVLEKSIQNFPNHLMPIFYLTIFALSILISYVYKKSKRHLKRRLL